MVRQSGLYAACVAGAVLCAGPALAADATKGFVPAPVPASVPAPIRTAVIDPARPIWHQARDASRHPAEVVAFAGIKSGDVVADFMPGDGYYTRILSNLIGQQGKVYALVPLPTGMRDGEMVRELEDKARKAGKAVPPNPVDTVLALQNVYRYRNVHVLWEMLYQYGAQFALPEQLDAVLTANAYHDLQNGTYGKLDMTAENKAVFQALKPGGVYLVVDAAAAKGSTNANALQRADADQVKKEILAAGFALDGENKLLANTADDHAKPAADNSDQFVLRFKKPANALAETKRPKNDPLKNWYENTQIGNIDAKGTESGNRPRWSIYHKDGSYEEMGPNNPLQEGIWFWDAAGHNCMLHQFPATQRQFIVCHDYVSDRRVGEIWDQGKNADGSLKKFGLFKGYLYPSLPDPGEIEKGF